jgi:hypothetical protein
MGDRAAQLKRLGFYKAFLKDLGKGNYDPESLKHASGYDPGSLERAATSLGLDHTNPSHQLMLALILADVQFGNRRRGRRKGVETTWGERKKRKLFEAYEDFRSRYPKYSDTKIAKLIISEIPEFSSYKGSRGTMTIRKKLREVVEFGVWDFAVKQIEDD